MSNAWSQRLKKTKPACRNWRGRSCGSSWPNWTIRRPRSVRSRRNCAMASQQPVQPVACDPSGRRPHGRERDRSHGRRSKPVSVWREFAAWLGMTPRQNSSGGKERLGRTSKRGHKCIRSLLVAAAVAVPAACARARDQGWRMGVRDVSAKASQARGDRSRQSNRRIVWAVMARGDAYDVDHRRLVDDEQIAIERIVGIAFEPTTSGIDLQEPVDRLALTIASRQFWLWRAADGEGGVLDLCSNDAGKRIGLRPHKLSARESAPDRRKRNISLRTPFPRAKGAKT
jgi:hypothetical protein